MACVHVHVCMCYLPDYVHGTGPAHDGGLQLRLDYLYRGCEGRTVCLCRAYGKKKRMGTGEEAGVREVLGGQ